VDFVDKVVHSIVRRVGKEKNGSIDLCRAQKNGFPPRKSAPAGKYGDICDTPPTDRLHPFAFFKHKKNDLFRVVMNTDRRKGRYPQP
jgi:hypothetical protein